MGEPRSPATAKPRLVRCPACGGDSVYAPDNPFRPFCSQRCKNLDLGAWASESFRVAGDNPPDDAPDPDAPLQ
ncbi:MAG TPA: DNA gyrase inhibitor YacG [Ramlibacter sp.]|jgi:hypothetical protein|nr:DNA gyrase inhibitor YacG [Ramlibacter sp.]